VGGEMKTLLSKQIGAVVIGRNEGERLRACLGALVKTLGCIVYVDSGSTDNSVAMAQSFGVSVVELDMTQPFTAARARNSGFERLMAVWPHLAYVQFIDGDCELVEAWLEHAFVFMHEHSDVAVVCGRRRERFPEQSIYNQLCDMEWATTVGEASACGGDALMRVDAFKQVQGYRNTLIAGEEPELCFRLRATGWRIWRLDQEMTLHDAAILHFSQWWKRTLRSGHAFTEGAYLHGKSEEKFWLREYQRIVLWGLLIPLVILIMSLISPLYLLSLLIYPLQMLKIAISTQEKWRLRFVWGFFMVLGKFPEALGLLRFWYSHFLNKTNGIIEYK
jgi:glycosyltransferase involved in cell wall biosynthesis